MAKQPGAAIEVLAYEAQVFTPSAWGSRHYVLFTNGVIVLIDDRDLHQLIPPESESSTPLSPFRP